MQARLGDLQEQCRQVHADTQDLMESYRRRSAEIGRVRGQRSPAHAHTARHDTRSARMQRACTIPDRADFPSRNASHAAAPQAASVHHCSRVMCWCAGAVTRRPHVDAGTRRDPSGQSRWTATHGQRRGRR